MAHHTVNVTIPQLSTPPRKVTASVGPTNSGKTAASLEELAQRGRGVYASPLRLLAQEVYAKLARRLGPDRVGLLTGERVINGDADIICCTAEMAPLRADFIVVDEAHWAVDRDRGPAWSRIFTGGDYESMSLIAATETLPLLRTLFPDVEVTHHARLGTLEFKGRVDLDHVGPRSVVVCFSRRAVLGLARLLQGRGLRVGALYGQLPPEVKLAQIEAFHRGDIDVVVSTDVIGHGLNLPSDSIIFAETTKFDGAVNRRLHSWEAAQIAGRAGRGPGSHGAVYALAGVRGCEPSGKLIEHAVKVASGTLASDLRSDALSVTPTFDDLKCDEPRMLSRALGAWRAAATDILDGHPWARPADPGATQGRFDTLKSLWGSSPWPVDAKTAHFLATTPIPRPSHLILVAREYAGERFDLTAELALDRQDHTIDQLETISEAGRALIVAARTAGSIGGYDVPALIEVVRTADARIGDLLADAIADNTIGACSKCEAPTALRTRLCKQCSSKAQRA